MWWETGRGEETDKRTRGARRECDTESPSAATSPSSWGWWCRRKRRFQAADMRVTLKICKSFHHFFDTCNISGLFSSLFHPFHWMRLHIFYLFKHPFSSKSAFFFLDLLTSDRWKCIYCCPLSLLLSLAKSLASFVALKYVEGVCSVLAQSRKKLYFILMQFLLDLRLTVITVHPRICCLILKMDPLQDWNALAIDQGSNIQLVAVLKHTFLYHMLHFVFASWLLCDCVWDAFAVFTSICVGSLQPQPLQI